MHYERKGLISICLAYFFFVAATCVEQAEPGPSPDDLTKEKRERLGDLLLQTMARSPNEFTILDRQSKHDLLIRDYLQTLYDQATQDIRQDRHSSPHDRWNPERTWQVVVLNDRNRFAFSVPGGHLFISTGFLGSLSKDYEIYYLMAFEAANVSGRYLIDNMVTEYSTATLLEIIDSPEASTNPTLLEIAQNLKRSLAFENDIIQEIDKNASELICQTSIFDRFGIITLLESLTSQEQWRDTRPSYANRLEYIKSLDIKGCGNIKSTGLYQKMVLENLP